MSVIEELAAFVEGASVARLPEAERAVMRRHVADAAIAGIAGARTGEAAAIRSLEPSATGREAVALAAAIVRHTEVDDIHLPSCTTPSSVAVPAALMLAAADGTDDPETIASAIWVGTELVVRFGVAIDGARALYRGVWPTCIAAPLGAAAVAARLWGLDRAQTANALSLALMLSAGRTGRFHGALPGRWVLFIGAIAEGLRAAQAARLGFCGDANLLDGNWLADAQGLQADVAKLTAGLGKTSVYPSLGLKPFCTARQGLAATQALIDLLDEGLDPRTIEAIKVRVPSAYAGMLSQRVDPTNRSSSIVSVGFQMALAALRRDSLWDIDRTAAMRDPAALGLAKRVSVEADPALQTEFPRHWPAAIEVVAGGSVIKRSVHIAAAIPSARSTMARSPTRRVAFSSRCWARRLRARRSPSPPRGLPMRGHAGA
jgi:2-methylcitrate dehydratase PrpD